MPALSTILAGVGAASSLAKTAHSIWGEDEEEENENRGSRLRRMFEDRYERLRDRSPTESAAFQAGTSALREAVGREAERDEAEAAARGLTGSQYEVAQDANRAETLGRETRSLIGTAERRLAQDRQSALRGLAEGFAFEEDIRARRQRREDRRNSRLAKLAGSALQSGATVLASRDWGNDGSSGNAVSGFLSPPSGGSNANWA